MSTLGNLKQKFARLSRHWTDVSRWRAIWEGMDARRRFTFGLTVAISVFCLIVYLLLIASCRGPAVFKPLGPSNADFASSPAPIPEVRIENVLERVKQSQTPRQKVAEALNAKTVEISDFVRIVLNGEKPGADWIGNYATARGTNRDQFQSSYSGDRIRVARWKKNEGAPQFTGSGAISSAIESCFQPWVGAPNLRIETTLSKFRIIQKVVTAEFSVQIFGSPDAFSGRQATSLWEMKWDFENFSNALTLRSMTIQGQEEIVNYTNGGTLLQDATGSVMKRMEFDQLFYGLDFWAKRIPGLDISGEHGIAVSDVNRDGFDDIYICQPHGLPNLLLVQQSDGTVDSVGHKMGVDILDESYAALLIDIDNDEDQDLVISTDEGLILMSQLGPDKPFQIEHRLMIGRGGRSLSAADYDQDGDLDLLVSKFPPVQSYSDFFAYPNSYSDGQNGGRNILLRNDESWKFTDVTERVGLGTNNHHYTRNTVWLDYDLDGDQDLYVANEFNRDQLYENDAGWFSDVSGRVAGVVNARHRSVSSGDFNSDGKPDLFVASALSDVMRQELDSIPEQMTSTQRMFLNACQIWLSGSDSSLFSGYQLPPPVFTPGSAFGSVTGDLNNDGVDDVIMTNGGLTRSRNKDVGFVLLREGLNSSDLEGNDTSVSAVRSAYQDISNLCRLGYSFDGNQRNKCFLSLGRVGFANFSACSGLDFADDARGVATTDWDGDGDLDVIMNSRGGPQIRILANQLSSENQSVTFELYCTKSNRDAIGSRVDVHLNNRPEPVTKTLRAGSGALSQSSKRLLVGLGKDPAIQKVVVTWPNGNEQTFFNIKPGRSYRLSDGSTEAAETMPNRFQHIAFQASPPPPPQITVTEQFERCVFYPKVDLPALEFQGAADSYFDIEIFENRPVLVVFWTRDTNSEKLLATIAEESRRYVDVNLDVIAIFVDLQSDSASSDWANASDSIEETKFPFRWGTAAASTVQKLELLFGQWFSHQDISELPFGLLIDKRRKLSVYYPARRLTFDRISSDLDLIVQPLVEYRTKAAPMGGFWTAPYRHPQYRRIITIFDQLGFKADARLLSEKEKPNLAAELTHRALELQSMGDIHEAKSFFERAIKEDPGCVIAYIGDGNLIMDSIGLESNPNLKNELYIDAKARFNSAIAIDPTNVEALLGSAEVSIAQKEIGEAISILKDYLATDPTKFQVHAMIGRLLYQQREYREAAQYLIKAFENRPTLPFIAGDLGCLYLRDSQYSNGLEYLRLARRLQPSDIDIALNLVDAEFLNGNYREAISLAEYCLARENDRKSVNVLAWLLATCPYENSRDGERALKTISPMVSLYSESSAATLEIHAAALAETGDFARAVEVQTAAVKLFNDNLSEEVYTEKQIEGLNARLALYKRGRAFRTSDSFEAPIMKPEFR